MLRTWIFQANPDLYNVISILENDEPIDAWSITHHAKEVTPLLSAVPTYGPDGELLSPTVREHPAGFTAGLSRRLRRAECTAARHGPGHRRAWKPWVTGLKYFGRFRTQAVASVSATLVSANESTIESWVSRAARRR